MVRRIKAVRGGSLPKVDRLATASAGSERWSRDARWILRGVPSYERYTTSAEHAELAARQPPLGRPGATFAALIPISKSEEWWALSHDRRRHIFAEASGHVEVGLGYLPAVARQLYHSRDLGEPFDFLTWFEYAPEDEGAFDALLRRLRGTEEWRYVDREVEIRVARPGAKLPEL